jgi:nucleotidyltransferase AbiEii toxin of type IV toxin-antitoxin system
LQPQSITEVYLEGQRYFMGEGRLNNALVRLVADLREHDIDYVVIGAIALLAYGYPRFTEDIDLVVTREGLARFHEKLIGLGYAPAFKGARKRLRSTRDGTPVELITAGEFPGDGKEKPVRFPDPSESFVEIDGVKFPSLEKLVELKLASGMTAPDRLKDLADVQELIKIRRLSNEFAEKLNPYVREKYLELVKAVVDGSSNSIEE